MKLPGSSRGLAAALTLAAATAAGSADYQLLAPKAGGGGGSIHGGPYEAFTTLAADATAAPLQGGAYELTGGLERRRDIVVPEGSIFRDGFEGQ